MSSKEHSPQKGERLQKILARAGVASRRAAETMISEGRVRVNGRVVTELGTRADPSRDRIELGNGRDWERLTGERLVYVLAHKPRGVVATLRDPEGRPSVGDMLQSVGVRTFPVGRLDFATSGVLLATNDGDFANALLHPRGGVPKRYIVKVSGLMKDKDLETWRRGVELEDGRTLPADVELLRHEGDKTWLELTIREGRNQQIRRMGEATSFPVMRLARASFAGITSEGLAPGRWRYLTRQELVDLKKTYGVPRKIPHDLPEGGGEGGLTRRSSSKGGGFRPRPGADLSGGLGAEPPSRGFRPRPGADGYGLGMAGRRLERDEGDESESLTNRRRGRAAMPMRTTGRNSHE